MDYQFISDPLKSMRVSTQEGGGNPKCVLYYGLLELLFRSLKCPSTNFHNVNIFIVQFIHLK